MLLYQILVVTIHEKTYKKIIKNNKFKISAPTLWNNKLELSDESCSVSDIQDYFENCLNVLGTIKHATQQTFVLMKTS